MSEKGGHRTFQRSDVSVCLSALKPNGGTLTPLHVAGSHEQFSVVLFPLSVASEAIGASLSLERRCHLAWRTAAPPGLPPPHSPPPRSLLCALLSSRLDLGLALCLWDLLGCLIAVPLLCDPCPLSHAPPFPSLSVGGGTSIPLLAQARTPGGHPRCFCVSHPGFREILSVLPS